MRLMLGVAALAANVIAAPAAIALDQSLPAYQAVTGISGQIKSVGSIRWATKSRYGPKHSRASTPT
jgi:hypothetical protein